MLRVFYNKTYHRSLHFINKRLISKMENTENQKMFAMDQFCLRQFLHEDENGKMRGIIEETPEFIEETINKMFSEGDYSLSDGYAPFCKVLFSNDFL